MQKNKPKLFTEVTERKENALAKWHRFVTGSLTCVVRIFFQPESQGWRNAVIILALQSFVNNWALSVSSWKAMVWYSNEFRTTVAKTFHLFSLRYQKRIWERLVATFVFYPWQLCRLHSRSGHSLSFQLAFQDLQERKQWDFYIVFKAILPKFSGYNPILPKNIRWRKFRGPDNMASSSSSSSCYKH